MEIMPTLMFMLGTLVTQNFTNQKKVIKRIVLSKSLIWINRLLLVFYSRAKVISFASLASPSDLRII